MSDVLLAKPYLQRVFAVQALGISAAFFTIWFAIGGLWGAIVVGVICGMNAISLKVLLHLIRRDQ